MEVSMPTGSLCAERNVIGTALADDVGLMRQDIKLIAVYSVNLNEPNAVPPPSEDMYINIQGSPVPKSPSMQQKRTILNIRDSDCTAKVEDKNMDIFMREPSKRARISEPLQRTMGSPISEYRDDITKQYDHDCSLRNELTETPAPTTRRTTIAVADRYVECIPILLF